MNVVYASRVQMNPYVSLLAAAMAKVATHVECVGGDAMSPRWLWGRRHDIDVLHLHWAELFYTSATQKGMWLKWLRLVSTLLLAKMLRVRLAYTVHNLSQHEGEHPSLNSVTNRLILALADVIHVHDAVAQREVARRFGRRRGVVVIPHGNYVSYPNACTREEARGQLGLSDAAFVYLFLGQVRPYKGVEDLINAFASAPDEDARLMIAGNVHTPQYAQELASLADRDSRILMHLRFIPEEELQYYLNASDICVLPYRHVTTSGAAILAFSFGKPVIAPSLGAFPELLDQGRGLLYDPTRDDGLSAALVQARSIDLREASRAARELAAKLDWLTIARQHLAAYQNA